MMTNGICYQAASTPLPLIKQFRLLSDLYCFVGYPRNLKLTSNLFSTLVADCALLNIVYSHELLG